MKFRDRLRGAGGHHVQKIGAGIDKIRIAKAIEAIAGSIICCSRLHCASEAPWFAGPPSI